MIIAGLSTVPKFKEEVFHPWTPLFKHCIGFWGVITVCVKTIVDPFGFTLSIIISWHYAFEGEKYGLPPLV
jgi:hypothetical protein